MVVVIHEAVEPTTISDGVQETDVIVDWKIWVVEEA